MAAPALIAVIPFLLGLLGNMQSLVPPFCNWSAQTLFSLWPNNLPDPSFVLNWYHQEFISKDVYHKLMRKMGYKQEYADFMIESTRMYLQISDYISLFRRGELSREALEQFAKRQKVDDYTLEQMLKATELLPGAQDLIRFAVREVFTPEIVDLYGLYEDYPDRLTSEGDKIGLTPENCLNNWAAHWELPSLGMGYEMFHRRIIDREGLKTLMRTQDIMPYWRDKLIELSYSKLTRVDVQRMYEIGTMDEEEVYNAFLDYGYSPENAKRMTEFTKIYRSNELSGITRSSLITSYINDIISKSELRNYLTVMLRNEDSVEYWIANADYKKAEDIINRYSNKLINQVRLGKMTLDEVQSEMARNEIPDTYIQKVLDEILDSKQLNEKLPSKADLLEWLHNHVISEQTFSYYMKLTGYTDDIIINYLTQLAIDEKTYLRRFLNDEVYIRWLETEIMTEEQFRQTLTDKGVSIKDIDRYIIEWKNKITKKG